MNKSNALVALTGAMGSGKSLARCAFENLGCKVLDADALAKRVLYEDMRAREKFVEILGAECFEHSGEPRKDKIAAVIFNDAKKLASYEAVIHPLTEVLWREELELGSEGIKIVEIPLLYEKNLEKSFDICTCLLCSEPIRLARLASRGLLPQMIAQRDKFQMPQVQKAARADVVFFNDGSVDFLKSQIELFVNRIRKKF